ncbi:MAG: hypothetical protein ACP5NW_00895 [Candidatus Woesearchaeota archaeon]
MDKLTYNDLKLGEQAKEAFFRGETPQVIEKTHPVYLNTREVFAGLNVTDMAIAAVIGGLNALYVGDTGTGKSQLAQDMFNYYFGGNISNSGHAVKIRGRPELDIYEEVYRDLNLREGRWMPNENIGALYHFLDEINRCPPITQNQFFGLGDGFLEHRGTKIPLGNKNYSVLIATANLGNGEFGGTFETDKALYNRFAIALDFDYEQYKPTREDRIIIDHLRSANPKIKDAPIKDISEKIFNASEEISESSMDLGLEANAAINYLKFGLENCYNEKIRSKEKNWPGACQDCDKNTEGNTICSLVREPLPRTINSLRKYSAAMDYLIKLKDPEQKYDAVDLVFKAFEIAGAYQKLLSPIILKQEYSEQNPKMMKFVVDELKKDFRKNEEQIIQSLSMAMKGEAYDDYYIEKKDPRTGVETGIICFNYSKLPKAAKEDTRNIEAYKPFMDNRPIGMSWVKTQAELFKKLHELEKKSKSKK